MAIRLRPLGALVDLHASIFIHAKPHTINLTPFPPSYENTWWLLDQIDSFYVAIVSLYEYERNLCMTVSAEDAPGTAVMAAPWVNSDSQKWTYELASDEYYIYKSKAGHVLSCQSYQKGANLVLGQKMDGQHWIITDDQNAQFAKSSLSG